MNMSADISAKEQEATWIGPALFTVVAIAILLVFNWMLGEG